MPQVTPAEPAGSVDRPSSLLRWIDSGCYRDRATSGIWGEGRWHHDAVRTDVSTCDPASRYPPLDQDEIRRIHASIYLREGYVDETALNPDGHVDERVDPTLRRSTWFAVDNGRVAVARQVQAKGRLGIASLPVIQNFQCDVSVLRKVADVEHLGDLPGNAVVEISSLAATNEAPTADGNLGPVIDLYLKMIRHSIEKGHRIWIMGTDQRLTSRLHMWLYAAERG